MLARWRIFGKMKPKLNDIRELPVPATDGGDEQFPISPDHVLSRHVTCHVSPDWSAQMTVVTSPWRVTRASCDGGLMSSQPTTTAVSQAIMYTSLQHDHDFQKTLRLNAKTTRLGCKLTPATSSAGAITVHSVVAPPGELRVNAGVVWFAGNTVWSTPECIRGEVLTTMCYTNWRLPTYLPTPSPSSLKYFSTLWPCDIDLWPFDLILNG